MTKKFLLLNSYVYLVEHKRIWLLCLHLFCFGGKSVVVLFFCDFLRKEYFISYHFFLNSFQCWRLYSRWYSTPSFCGWSYIENLAASTGKTEKPTEQLLHGANKVQPRKETLSKCKVHTRKSDGNDSSYSSYAVNDSNFYSWWKFNKNLSFVYFIWSLCCSFTILLIFPR